MDHVPNPTKPHTMARTESDSHVDTTCDGKNMKPLSYTGYEFNVNGLHSDLKSMENIRLATSVTTYDDPLSGLAVMLVFNQEILFESSTGNT